MLFSIFPLAIVLTGILGIVVQLTGLQADLVDTIVRNVPVSASGEEQLRSLLEGATSSYSALGLLGVLGLVWAASGMMAAVRVALNAAWDVDEARPFLKGKLIDVGLVFMVAARRARVDRRNRRRQDRLARRRARRSGSTSPPAGPAGCWASCSRS